MSIWKGCTVWFQRCDNLEKANYKDSKKISGCQDLRGREWWTGWQIFRVVVVFCILYYNVLYYNDGYAWCFDLYIMSHEPYCKLWILGVSNVLVGLSVVTSVPLLSGCECWTKGIWKLYLPLSFAET